VHFEKKKDPRYDVKMDKQQKRENPTEGKTEGCKDTMGIKKRKKMYGA
jgi:hypothetical protein